MQKINFEGFESYQDNGTKGYSYLKSEVMADSDVIQFIETNEIPEEIVQRDILKLAEYNKEKVFNPTLKPKLEFYNNRISVTYDFKKNEVGQRAESNVSTSLICDTNTKKYKHKLYFKDLEIDQDNYELYKMLSNFVSDYSYENGVKGIWLHGTYGIGKSYFMSAFANEINEKGAGVQFASTQTLLNYLKNGMGYKVNNNQKRIEELKRAEILILDDIGTEKPSDWSIKNVIYEIIDYRFVQEKPTFFTSNLSIKEYETAIKTGLSNSLDAERLVERIEVLAREKRLGGKNRRVKQ